MSFFKKMKDKKQREEYAKRRREHTAKLKREPSGDEIDRINERFAGNEFLQEVISACTPLEDISQVTVERKWVTVYTVFPEKDSMSLYPGNKHKIFAYDRYGYNEIDMDTARDMLYYIASRAFYKGFTYGYSLSPYSQIGPDIVDGIYAINNARIPLEDRRKNF